MFGSRRRKVALGLIATISLLAGVGTGVSVGLTTGYSESDASWQLLSASSDGRALTIREPPRGACDRVESSIDDGSDDRIEVHVQLLEPRGGGSCNAMLVGGKTRTFRLDRPLAGRAITGPKKRLAPPYDIDQNGRSSRYRLTSKPEPIPTTRVPVVVGFRYGDARDALCNAGFQARPATGDRSRGEVVAQAPPREQPRSGAPRTLKCTNGLLPAVELRMRP